MFSIFPIFTYTRALSGESTWYLGEGLEQGLLVKYRISVLGHDDGGRPLLATIWFGSQEYDNWKTSVLVEDGGMIVTASLIFSDLNLYPIGSGKTFK